MLAEKLSDELNGIVKHETLKINSKISGFHNGDIQKLKNKLQKKVRHPPTAIKNLSSFSLDSPPLHPFFLQTFFPLTSEQGQ